MIENIQSILDFPLVTWNDGKNTIQVWNIFMLLALWLIAKLVLWLIKKVISRRVESHHLDEGKGYAIHQITSYFIYILTVLLGLDMMGFHITVILASSTALLVGLGLGVQDVFKDWVAGFVLLAERAITAGDIIEVDGIVGRIEEVGLRTTIIKTRDDIILVLPNQRLTSNYVINWTQNGRSTRFSVDVGVAYGSDTSRVKELLFEAAHDHNLVSNTPAPRVFFEDFGDSALLFKLMFFTDEMFIVERIKSDLRFSIDKKFRAHQITIPFPQRDLWIKNPNNLSSNTDS